MQYMLLQFYNYNNKFAECKLSTSSNVYVLGVGESGLCIYICMYMYLHVYE